MKITSAVFKIGLIGDNRILDDRTPQIAFIGRSNAGKSSLLNSLTGKKKLAITSNTPGRTKEINVFSINGTHYFLDLPGYGYARVGGKTLRKLNNLISWYLFDSNHNPKVVLVIDSVVGPTVDDLYILKELEKTSKEIIVVANKADKIKKSHYLNQIIKIQQQTSAHKIFPYSSITKVGIEELRDEIMSSTYGLL